MRAGRSGPFVALIAAIGAEAERGPTLRLGEEGEKNHQRADDRGEHARRIQIL
jgi:hypothetical protein